MRTWEITYKRFDGDLDRVKVIEGDEFQFGDSEPASPTNIEEV